MSNLALFVVLVAGCSALEYPRVSAGTYYLSLASSYSPVVQWGERRIEGPGICFVLHEGKVPVKGFVTLADIDSAAKTRPDLRMAARVHQLAFAEAMLKGMQDSFNGSALSPSQKARLLLEMDVPADMKDHADEWRSAWYNGYGYGEYLSRFLK